MRHSCDEAKPPAVKHPADIVARGRVSMRGDGNVLWLTDLPNQLWYLSAPPQHPCRTIGANSLPHPRKIPRSSEQVLIGKWFGFVGMLTAYIAIMVGGVNSVTYVMAGVTARHLIRGCLLMWMESLVLLSVTFAFATYFSTLTSGVLALGLHGLAFLGGWIEQFGPHADTPCRKYWRNCQRADAQRSPLAPRCL